MKREVTRKPDGAVSGKSERPRRGRPKALRISVQSLKHIPGLLERFQMPPGILTYRDIAQELTRRSGIQVSTGAVYRLAHGKEPDGADLRRALNLPKRVKVLACPHCGQVHTRNTCPDRRNGHGKPGPHRWIVTGRTVAALANSAMRQLTAEQRAELVTLLNPDKSTGL